MTLGYRPTFQEVEEHQDDIIQLYLGRRLSLREVAKEMKQRGCTFSYRCLHEWLKERGYVRSQGSSKGHGRVGKPVRNIDCVICQQSFLPESSRHRYCRQCIPNPQAWHHWKRYGLTVDQFDALMQKQDGKCAGCDRDFALLTGIKNDVAHVDHCHVTGEIRGLLCRPCNTILGLAEDDSYRLQRLAAYVENDPRGSVGSMP